MMEKIALRRMGVWFRDAWRLYAAHRSDLLPFGFFVFLIALVQQFIGLPLLCAICAPSLAVVLALFLGASALFLSASIWTGLCGVATAVLHRRPPLGDDFRLDRAVHVQGLLAYIGQGVMIGAFAAVGSVPGMAFIMPAAAQDRPILLLLGVPLLLFVALPALLAGYALTMFATPLAVEKRLDAWSALVLSIDCARRDLAGLMVFALVFALLWWFTVVATFGLGIIFLSPFFGLLLMRAHVDYFGLDVDHWVPTYLDEAVGPGLDAPSPAGSAHPFPAPPPLPGDDRRPRAFSPAGPPAGLWRTPPSEAPPSALSSEEVDIPADQLPPPPPPAV